jgi:hypothetical protein
MMKKTPHFAVLPMGSWASMGLSVMLTACGGGGGGEPAPTAPVLGAQPQAATVLAGKTATFSATAPAETAATFQWRLNGQVLANGAVASGVCAGAVASGATAATLTLANAPLTCDQSRLSVQVGNATGSTPSNEAGLTVFGFTTQPANKALFVSGGATLSALSNAPAAATTLQWKLNGADLPNGVINGGACAGATAAGSTTLALTLTGVPSTCDGALFGIALSLGAETLASPQATLAVTQVSAAPAAATVLAGSAAVFRVATTGSAALQYAWGLNGQVLANGAVASGPCAGAVASGATTAAMTLSSAPTGCHNSPVTVTLTNASGVSLTPTAVVLNVAGFASQPMLPASVTSGTSVELAAPSGGFTVASTTVWSLNGAALSNGIQGSGICAGMSVVGATSSTLGLSNIPTSCSGAVVTATLSNTLGTVSSTPATLSVAAGDARNGTYKAFASNGVTYDLTVNFNNNSYRVVSPSGAALAGTLGANTTATGATEMGTFSLSRTGSTGLGGALRVVTDGLVGNLQPASGADAVPFIAARRFLRAASELSAPVDFRILGRDFNTTNPNAPDSRIATAQVSASGFGTCTGNAIASVANCTAVGNSLLSYSATYNADGSVLLVNPADATDVAVAYFAKLGTEWVYLRANNNPAGVARVRYGIESNNTVGAQGFAATTDATWVSMLDVGAANLTMNGLGNNGLTVLRNGSFTGQFLGTGLVTYTQADGSVYFAARSPLLVIVAGARDTTRPTLNGHLALGTANP